MTAPRYNLYAFARQAPYLLLGDRLEETAYVYEGGTVYRIATVPRKDGSDRHQWSADGVEIKEFELNLIAADSSLDVALIFEILTPGGEERVLSLECIG